MDKPTVIAAEPAELALDAQLCFALYTANNWMVSVYGAALQPLGLTVPQTLVLMTLWESSPRLVGSIAQALHLDNGSVSPVLKRLEANGFVRRVRDTVDERCVHVHITDKGLAIREPILVARRDVIAAVGMPQAEADALMVHLASLTRHLLHRRGRGVAKPAPRSSSGGGGLGSPRFQAMPASAAAAGKQADR